MSPQAAPLAIKIKLIMRSQYQKLARDFYDRDTQTVARELLGKWLIRREAGGFRIGRIVETEAYLGPHDLAAHSSKGLTNRTKAMFGPPGHAYVYLIYGIHHCMNVVTEPEGSGSGVLLRALEPIENISDNTRGPGLLTRAMGITRKDYGHDLCSDDFFLANPNKTMPFEIASSPRIGVRYAKEWADKPLRFFIAHNPYVSGPKKYHPPLSS
ncbi:MAG TPA: DNA-3-methyladenine glycosylase [Burkholderiaceae bacterium]|nr:DNA-3-methyladenine glycosylase [Burkholderiaceae bacterium]